MSKQNSANIDIGEALVHFFYLKDWKERALKLGGLYLLIFMGIFVIYLIAAIVFIIPVIGWIFGCLLYVFVMVVMIVIQLYQQGYKFDVAEAVRKGEEISSVAILDADYKLRIKKGFHYFLANLIYFIPVILGYFVAYFFLFAMLAITEGGFESSSQDLSGAGLITILIFYLLVFVLIAMQMVIQFVVSPSLAVLYLTKKTFSEVINVRNVWNFIRDNIIGILMYAAAVFLAGMLIGFAGMVSLILVFVCIGIFLYPIVIAVGTLYLTHVQGHLIGQLARDA